MRLHWMRLCGLVCPAASDAVHVLYGAGCHCRYRQVRRAVHILRRQRGNASIASLRRALLNALHAAQMPLCTCAVDFAPHALRSAEFIGTKLCHGAAVSGHGNGFCFNHYTLDNCIARFPQYVLVDLSTCEEMRPRRGPSGCLIMPCRPRKCCPEKHQ